MNNNTEHPDIDAYLLGHLSPEARADFEAAMGQDEALTTAVEVRRLEFEVAEAIVAQDIRAQITALRAEDIRSKDTTTNPLPRWRYWWLGGVLLCLIVLFFRVNWPTASTGLPRRHPCRCLLRRYPMLFRRQKKPLHLRRIHRLSHACRLRLVR